MSEWQPIATAPKQSPHDGLIDILAKTWNAKTDRFQYRRFVDCYWLKDRERWCSVDWDSPLPMASYNEDRFIPDKWHPSHWMPRPPYLPPSVSLSSPKGTEP
jgi:hypothetical protein